MSAQGMLEQLLKSGASLLGGQGGGLGNLGGGLDKLMGGQGGRAGSSDAGWGKFGAGMGVGGALGLLLGSKRGRSYGGKALKYGSIAALGLMAYKAYGNWQAQQQQQQKQQQPGQPLPLAAPRTIDRLPAAEVEEHSRALLKAMIAAAKADGHLDEREQGLLGAELDRLEADPALRQWHEAEVRRPLDPAEVARAASTPELAAEMYLASLLVADETSYMERAYLDELARQLKLPDGLKAELEAQALNVG